MKIIDKTPYQNAQGVIDFSGRVQGSLRYGFGWYAELEAQKAVIAQLDRSLEKGFVLIRNFTLPNSDIVIPLILIGPGGVWVIYVTTNKGYFEAKGDQWNTVNNDRVQPASVNLLTIVARLARALQVYLDRQKIELPAPIDPVLIAADPGAHVDSLRPVIRVVQSDAIKLFAASLAQVRPILRSDLIFSIADRIVEPRPPEEPKKEETPQPASAAQVPEQASARARAIFEASDQAKPFNASELDFALEDENGAGVPPNLRETSPARPLPKQPVEKKILGMTGKQAILLAVMFIAECCVLAVGVYIIYSLNQ